MADSGNKQNRVEQLIDTHREVVEKAISSGFGIFSTPEKPEKPDDKKDK